MILCSSPAIWRPLPTPAPSPSLKLQEQRKAVVRKEAHCGKAAKEDTVTYAAYDRHECCDVGRCDSTRSDAIMAERH